MNLTKTDYDILCFVSKFDSMDSETIFKHFSEDDKAIKLRLDILSEPLYKNHVPIADTAYLEEGTKETEIPNYPIPLDIPNGIYKITALGKKTLEDYKIKRKMKRTRLIYSVIAPITVSIIANLVVSAIKLHWQLP